MRIKIITNNKHLLLIYYTAIWSAILYLMNNVITNKLPQHYNQLYSTEINFPTLFYISSGVKWARYKNFVVQPYVLLAICCASLLSDKSYVTWDIIFDAAFSVWMNKFNFYTFLDSSIYNIYCLVEKLVPWIFTQHYCIARMNKTRYLI